jgi:opacity protein-like surface antigen
MNARLVSLACAAALATAMPAAQAADGGLYAGLGMGRMTTTDYLPPARIDLFDETANQWRIFGGYRTGIVPILDFAAEVGYRNVGSASATINGNTAEYKTKGLDAAVLGIFPFLGADLFGKVGVMQYDLDRTVNGARSSFSGTAPLYGIGVGFRVWRVGVRLEYERFEVDELKLLSGATASVTFRF